jgi:hypothetical protein
VGGRVTLTFKQGPEGEDGVSPIGYLRERVFWAEGIESKCKGPKADNHGMLRE